MIGAVLGVALAGWSAPAAAASAAVAPAASAAPAVAAAPAAAAVRPPAPPDPATVLADAQQTLIQLQNQVPTTSNDTRLAAMGARAAAIEAQADQLAAGADRGLVPIDKALKRLVPNPRRAVPASQKAQVAALTASRDALQSQLNQAQALSSAASSTYSLVAERRREGFSARVLQQSDSPLSPGFWSSLADSAGPDVTRLGTLARNAANVAVDAAEPRAGIGLGLGLAIGLMLLFPVRWGLERLGRKALDRKRGRRGFGLTAYALWVTAVDTGAPTLAALSLRLGAQWGGLLSAKADQLAGAAVVAVAWGAAILALGRALATDLEADRRLLGFPDRAARRMGPLLLAVAIITATGFLLTRLNYAVGASVAATIAANCVLSLAYAGIAGAILVSFGRSRAPGESPPNESGRAEAPPSPVWTLVSLALWGAVLVTVCAVFAGFTTLAALISNQIFWLSVLAASTFLLLRFIDDLAGALFGERGWAARTLRVLFSFRRSTIAQTGILISAALQLFVLIGALTLALTPFGEGGDLFVAHLSQLGQSIHIGSATISPAAIVSGLGALAVGMGLVHLVRGWVVRRYLPATDWDAGLRNSVSTGVGYIGVGIALLCAFAAMGLGFAQIALIASALSVGIGFGLQQVVQNFVSGVIVLVERPVKVGDWVNVGGVEGNIRRIRVRATDIETFDRTTVIVPNSDLITKQVQNKTLGDPRGRIKLELAIADPRDAGRARDLILGVADARAEILKEPKPVVYIDSLAGGGAVNFIAYLFVGNPRDVYRLRSELYFALLEAFQAANIAFVGAAGPTNVVVEPGPAMQSALAALAGGEPLPQPLRSAGR
jgi:small-conductance mechanosensitive channel